MLPTISNVQSIEMIRDGGSLAAKFDTADGATYILLLKIRMEIGDDPTITGEYEETTVASLGYDQPVLIDCDPAKRPPDTDAMVHSASSGPCQLLSWSEARSIFEGIERVVGALAENPLKWLHMMGFTIQNDGCLPPGIKATSKARRHIL